MYGYGCEDGTPLNPNPYEDVCHEDWGRWTRLLMAVRADGVRFKRGSEKGVPHRSGIHVAPTVSHVNTFKETKKTLFMLTTI